MRLLGCFSKPPVVLDPPAAPSGAASPSAAAAAAASPPAFVPASIPELHPEYAHSEPYCFAARTDSARLLVDRVRAAKGQTSASPGDADPPAPRVVVRGPSYAPKPAPVALKVETPDPVLLESSDDADAENRDTTNLAAPRASKLRASGKISTRRAKNKRSLPRKSKTKDRSRPPSKQALVPNVDGDNASTNATPPSRNSTASRRRGDTLPARTYSSSDADTDEQRRTPPALLAPIRVPRMSDVFEDNGEPRFIHSPALSNDSWALNDCAERFDDIEDDLSSGIVKLAAVGKQKVVHKAALPHPSQDEDDRSDPPRDDDTLGGGASVTAASGGRGKRKSKPFLEGTNVLGALDNSAPPLAPDSSYDQDHDPMTTLPPAMLSRQISAGVMSDDIKFVDTSGDDMYHMPAPMALESRHRQAAADVFQIPDPSLSPNTAASSQRIQHDDLLQLPQASSGAPQGIMRRSSAANNKRKTVSFHDESPVIIEPNLRAPRSLPRESMLTKSSSEASEYKDALDVQPDSFSTLRGVRDSVSLAVHNRAPNKMFASIKPKPSAEAIAAASPPPKTLDVPRPRSQREFSDSSEEPFQARSSRRMSRVSVHDKNAIREASKRQSRAVAQAMSEQIRGIPKSAMLAFSENEVLISDDALDEDSDLSFRRRSARAKSIRVPPPVVPGQVPLPPPPPPFQPETQRVRSVRKPPPPPVSPIRR